MGKDQIWSLSDGRDEEDLDWKSSKEKEGKRVLEREMLSIMDDKLVR